MPDLSDLNPCVPPPCRAVVILLASRSQEAEPSQGHVLAGQRKRLTALRFSALSVSLAKIVSRVAVVARTCSSVLQARRPEALGLASPPIRVDSQSPDVRLRDLLSVSKIRTDFVAILAVSETTLRIRVRKGS